MFNTLVNSAEEIMKRLLLLFVLFTVFTAACKEQTKEEIFQQGMEFVDNGNNQAAVTLFKNALEKDPNYIDARLQLGFAYLETGKYDKAENELVKALRQQPENNHAIL
jgi:Tfp pilus assembly protein PilF